MTKAQPKTKKEVVSQRNNPVLAEIELKKIDSFYVGSQPYQPRRTQPDKDEFERFKANIKAIGQKTPIRVRPSTSKEGRYELADGAMRKQAKQELGDKTILAIVEPLTDRQMKIISVSTNTFLKMVDIDRETAFYNLWATEFRMDEASSKGGRRDATYTGIREMERETGWDASTIIRYLQAHDARKALMKDESKEVQKDIKEISSHDLQDLASIAKQNPEVVKAVIKARTAEELKPKDVRAIVKTLQETHPDERAEVAEKIVTAKREQQKAHDAVDKKTAEIVKAIDDKFVASPAEKEKRRAERESDRDKAFREEQERLQRESERSKAKLDSEQLQSFIRIEHQLSAYFADDIARRVFNVRDESVKKQTIDTIKRIGALVSEFVGKFNK